MNANNMNLPDATANIPLLIFQPMNLIIFLVFYSPIIIALGILSISIAYNNFSGLIYVGFLLAATILREFILIFGIGVQPKESNRNLCNMIQYSMFKDFQNAGYSIFAITFTLFYLCTPMFLNKDINYLVLSILIFYLLLDFSIRYSKQCITSAVAILGNILSGAVLGLTIPILFYSTGASKYMIFNEISSSKEVCSMPKKQQFKCSVYKNGQLVGSTNNS